MSYVGRLGFAGYHHWCDPCLKTHGILHENGLFFQGLRKGNRVHETWSMPQECQNKRAKKAMKANKKDAAHKKPAAKKSKK